MRLFPLVMFTLLSLVITYTPPLHAQQLESLDDPYKDKSYSRPFSAMIQSVNQEINQPLYDSILLALQNLDDKINISAYSQSSSEVFQTRQRVLDDHPEIFYFTHEESYYWTNGDLEFKYMYPKNQIVEMKQELEQKVQSIIDQTISENHSEFEKVRAIHDYLVLHSEYDWENLQNDTIPELSYTAYGLLTRGIAVCDGYSKAMKLILERIGIETLYVVGEVASGLHSWNKVKIADQYYNLDATWDDPVPDQKNYLRYSYFLITDEELQKDHIWNHGDYPVAEDLTYAYMKNMFHPFLYEDFFYYSDPTDDHKLYKIRQDGTEKEKLDDVRALYIQVYEDWIYFSNYSHGGYLFKMRTYGAEKTELNEFHSTDLYIEDGSLFYTNEEDQQIYQIQLETFNPDANQDDIVDLYDLIYGAKTLPNDVPKWVEHYGEVY